MNNTWYMLTIVGEDCPGIVAKVSTRLYELGCNLGEASMMRLGGNFTTMMMVQFEGSKRQLLDAITPIAELLSLHFHLDQIDGRLHDHPLANVSISVYGADKAGIVAQVTTELANAGMNILELESDVGGSEEKPVYIMQILGHTENELAKLENIIKNLSGKDIEVRLEPIDTMVG